VIDREYFETKGQEEGVLSKSNNGTQPSRSEKRADVTNVQCTGSREAKSRLDGLKCSDVLDLVVFMHDPGQGRTGMRIEFGTPDLPNPLCTSLGLATIRLEIIVQGS
jgi:hypothetical protein